MTRKKMIVSVYGRSRIWRQRKDGHWQRYWCSTRFDLKGTGQQLRRSVRLIADKKLAPKKRFVRIQARQFLHSPERYAQFGFMLKVETPRGRRRRRRRRW